MLKAFKRVDGNLQRGQEHGKKANKMSSASAFISMCVCVGVCSVCPVCLYSLCVYGWIGDPDLSPLQENNLASRKWGNHSGTKKVKVGKRV